MALTEKLINIADTIRTKTGSTALLTLDAMPTAINTISSSDLDKFIEGNLSTITSNAQYIERNSFRGVEYVNGVNFPEATRIHGFAFYECTKLRSGEFPKVESIANSAFYNCGKVFTFDFPSLIAIDTNVFYGCGYLENLIIRTQSCLLADTNALDGTSLATGYGFIYVPDDAVEYYKSDTNWSAYASQIKGISELPT